MSNYVYVLTTDSVDWDSYPCVSGVFGTVQSAVDYVREENTVVCKDVDWGLLPEDHEHERTVFSVHGYQELPEDVFQDDDGEWFTLYQEHGGSPIERDYIEHYRVVFTLKSYKVDKLCVNS